MPVAPVSPRGIVKFIVCEGAVPVIVTIGCVPEDPTDTVPTVKVLAGPGPPRTPSIPLGILKVRD